MWFEDEEVVLYKVSYVWLAPSVCQGSYYVVEYEAVWVFEEVRRRVGRRKRGQGERGVGVARIRTIPTYV